MSTPTQRAKDEAAYWTWNNSQDTDEMQSISWEEVWHAALAYSRAHPVLPDGQVAVDREELVKLRSIVDGLSTTLRIFGEPKFTRCTEDFLYDNKEQLAALLAQRAKGEGK